MSSVNTLIVEQPTESCDVELAKGPWEFDTFPGYGPGASEDDVIPEPVVRPGQLPAAYQRMSDEELHA
ncbi:MAG: quinolinate synthase NadA, partial [Aeromicrobium sp.]